MEVCNFVRNFLSEFCTEIIQQRERGGFFQYTDVDTSIFSANTHNGSLILLLR